MRIIKEYITNCINGWHFSLGDKYYSFLSKPNLLIVTDGENEISLSTTKLNKVVIHRNMLIIRHKGNKTEIYLIDAKNLRPINIFTEFEEIDIFQNFNNRYWKYKKYLSPMEVQIGLFDIREHHKLGLSANFYPQYIKDIFIIGKLNYNIIRYLVDGQINWQFDISNVPLYQEMNENKLNEIIQYLGIHNDTLWIQLNGERLLGLDIDTGDQKHLLSNIARGVGDNYLDEKTGVIKILAGHHYWEYDLNILEYRKKIALDDEKKWFIRSCNYYPDDPNIYFCGHFDNWDFPNAYGIYDTRKDKITWHHIGQTPEEKYYNPPQANEKIIGILDDSGRLMVYEKNI